MAINSDIRDQAYQFFIEEAPDLLQVIEAGLLTLRAERSTAKVHDLMRAAHSIKGGSASVELEAIATLAHRLENIFKALYDEKLEIDTDLESQLLQAYDCLRLPLMEQLMAGYFDAEQALALADPLFSQIEERLGDALTKADSYIASSSDLGIDMTKSIFEVDVGQGLEHLAAVLANPQDYEVVGELRAQVEVFAGFAELLNLPEFGAIAQTTRAAVDAQPDRVLEIMQLALADFQAVRQAVLAGNTPDASYSSSLEAAELTHTSEISPSGALASLANPTANNTPHSTTIPTAESIADLGIIVEEQVANKENFIPSLEDIFGSAIATFDLNIDERTVSVEASEDTQTTDEHEALEETFRISPENVVDSTVISSESDADTDTPDSEILEVEWVSGGKAVTDAAIEEFFSNEEAVTSAVTTPETEPDTDQAREEDTEAQEHANTGNLRAALSASSFSPASIPNSQVPITDTPQSLEEAVLSIEQIFDSLPQVQDIPASVSQSNPTDSTAANSPKVSKADSLVPTPPVVDERLQISQAASSSNPRPNELNQSAANISQTETSPTSNLSVRVDSERLGRINNLVGELAINRNGLSLQNEQLQDSVRELLNRFGRVHNVVGQLQELLDQMLVAPERFHDGKLPRLVAQLGELAITRADFDSLELDSYGTLHSRLQGLLEEMMQLEEAVDDIGLFAKATDQSLEQQRQMLTQLRDQLMWASMLPLGEVLNRFPRMLRDLSTTYHKPVSLKLSGTSVLVDKAVLEKLYDPLLHLIRNAFDHGIESPEIRRQRGKPQQGQIEIRAYHQGSQTVIEVRDDGQGLNLERIRNVAIGRGLLPAEQVATVSNTRLFELIFEPGFSTASRVSELSGRGVGLDVVRSQMRSLKGTLSVTSEAGVGTTFTLRLPLTLTIAKLLVCFIGSLALAVPSDSIEEIVVPKGEQIKQSGTKRFLHWRGQIVPAYRLADFLDYACPLPQTSPSKALISVPSPKNWALPMLILRQDQNFFALEIDRLVTEQELVIKSFGGAIAPPSCTYGCTILGDGSLIPVLDVVVLLDQLLGQSTSATAVKTRFKPQDAMAKSLSQGNIATEHMSGSQTKATPKMRQVPTVLVVDDAVALRRTLALTLERAGCRVLQARDGREAIEQLQQSSSVDLVICDIEMPNMNGFEFLSYRRQEPQLLKTPVVMLTSRSNDKHRWLAMQLGATAYFTKPYLEQEFLGAVKHIIGQSKPENLPALQPTL
jgi:chemotaxis family two-component system sensor histidine kinase/response regulator PixL